MGNHLFIASILFLSTIVEICEINTTNKNVSILYQKQDNMSRNKKAIALASDDFSEKKANTNFSIDTISISQS